MNFKKILGRIFQHDCNNCGMCMKKSVNVKYKDKDGFKNINSDDKEE